MTDDPVADALELLDDGRVEEALALLKAAVTEEPDGAGLRALYALILADTGHADEAERHADIAVALDDELPFAQFAAGEVAFAQERFSDAIRHASAASELSPDDADPIVLEARARARLGDWDRVRALAQRAQVLDPGNEGAVMLAAMSDEVETDAPLDDARWQTLVEKFPTNAFARSGRAWAQLQAGKATEARKEFEQALALDPSLAWARDGYIAAIKAQNPLYRGLLSALRRLQHLDPRTRSAVIIGAFVLYQALRFLADANPMLRPLIWPLLALYLGFLFVSWLADPLLDLALLARKETRPFIAPAAVRAALCAAAALIAASALALAALLVPWPAGFALAVGAAFTSFTFTAAYGHPRRRMRTRLLRMGWAAVACLVLAGVAPDPWNGPLFLVAVLMVVVSTWMSRTARV